MKKRGILSGIILIGFGIYFLLLQYNIQLIADLYTWPTLLIIVGVAFLAQAYGGKQYEFIFPGIILTGLGIHFHVVHKLEVWPDHAGVFLLVVSLGLLLTYVKTNAGFFSGILFLIAAVLTLFVDHLAEWALQQGHDLSLILQFWPFLFIAIGTYLLFAQRK